MPPHADKNTPQTTHQRANIKYHERRQPDARTKRHDDVNLLEDVRPRRLPVRRHAPIRRKRHNLARQILPRFPIRHTLHHRKPARPHPTTSMPWAGLDEDVSRRETTMRVDASFVACSCRRGEARRGEERRGEERRVWRAHCVVLDLDLGL